MTCPKVFLLIYLQKLGCCLRIKFIILEPCGARTLTKINFPMGTRTIMKQKPTTKLRILLTGAAGLVGTILRSAWELDDQYQLTAVDLNDSDSNIQKADIRKAAQMKAICQNQDVLVHLAYIGYQDILKHSTQMTDITASMLLFEIAREAGIKKIIYASTNAVTGWNEKLAQPANDNWTGLPPKASTADQFRPDSWYGVMKGMAEIAGRYLVDAHQIQFISIRIGSFIGGNEPNDIRHCSTLLTPRDCVQLFSLAVDYQGPIKYLITYGTSGNTDGYQVGFMDIRPAVEILGYRPKDNLIQTHRHRFI